LFHIVSAFAAESAKKLTLNSASD